MRRTKPHPKKDLQLKGLTERLSRANVAIVTDYRGLTVAQLTQLRRQLDPLKVEYQIAKNTLLRIAGRQAGTPDLTSLTTGPTGIAFGYADESATAKAMTDFARTSKVLKVKGGVLGQRLMGAEDVVSLASIPPKGQLYSQVLGALQGPSSRVLAVLSGPSRSLLYLLQQRAEQLEAQAGA